MQDFVNTLTLLGIPLFLLVPFVVQGMKTVLGLPTNWAGPMNIILAAVFLALRAMVQQWPETTPIAVFFVGTFVIGLGGPGLYDLAKGAAAAIQARAPPQ